MKTLRYTLICAVACLLLILGATPSQAQNTSVTFTAEGGEAAVGQQITVPVKVANFNNIATTQFTIEWDPAVMTPVGFSDFSQSPLDWLSSANFGASEELLNDGTITFSWDDQDPDELPAGGLTPGDGIPEGETLPDGTTIFSITFDVIGGSSTPIGFTGTKTAIEATAFDEAGAQQLISFDGVSGTVSVTPSDVNTPPQITTPADQASAEGDSPQLQVQASDADTDDVLTFGASGLPSGLSINPATGLISGTISAGAAASSPYSVTVTVGDGEASANAQFNWAVSAAPEPAMSVTPLSVDFGTVTVGSSAASTVTVSSTGGAALENLTVSLGSSSPFSITDNGCSATLVAGATCDVDLAYAPTSAGTQSITLAVTSNAGTQSVQLSGTGESETQPGEGVTFSTASVTGPVGGQVVVDVTVEDFVSIDGAQFTLTWNETVLQFAGVTDDDNLIGVSPGIMGEPGEGTIPTNALTFAWDDPQGTGQTLADGTAIFSVVFNAVGQAGDTSPVNFADAPTPREVSSNLTVLPFLVSEGVVTLAVPPAASVSPTSLGFGSVEVDSEASQTVTLLSNGGMDLVLNSLDINGSGDFSESDNCPSTLAAGASCTITVTFAPASAGDKVGTLVITSNAGTDEVALSGTAPEPVVPTPGLSVSAPSLDFGTILTTGSLTQSLTVTSTGDADLTFSSIGISGLGATSYSQTNTCSAALAPGGSCTIEVVFAPANEGAKNATLAIQTNAGTQNVSLSGVGEAPPPPTRSDEITFSVESTDVAAGGQVTVDVSVEGFTLVTGAQFTLVWDNSLLDMVSVNAGDLPDVGSYNAGSVEGVFGEPAPGTLTFAWDDLQAEGATLPDGSVIFSMTFDAIGSGDTNAPISFANSPTPQGVFVEFEQAVFIAENGVVSILDEVAIGGTVTYLDTAPLQGASLVLAGNQVQNATSASDGGFAFSAPVGIDYQLAASMSEATPKTSVVTVNDMTTTRRHILGVTPLNSPYKELATDVDGSGTVTVNDISIMRQFILGKQVDFQGKLWECVVEGSTLASQTYEYTYLGLSQTLTGQDFSCFRLGDADGNWATPNGAAALAAKSHGGMGFYIETQPSSVEGEVLAFVRAEQFEDIGGYQFTLEWNADALEYAGVEQFGVQGLQGRNFGTHRAGEGFLTTVWSHPEGKGATLEDGSPLFVVRFRTSGAKEATLDFSSAVTPMLAHRGDATLSPVSMRGTPAQIAPINVPQSFSLKGNYPNPFTQSTQVAFDLPEAAEVSVDVFDALGRLVLQVPAQQTSAGTGRTIGVDASRFASGVYFYRVTVDMASGERVVRSGRMAVVK